MGLQLSAETGLPRILGVGRAIKLKNYTIVLASYVPLSENSSKSLELLIKHIYTELLNLAAIAVLQWPEVLKGGKLKGKSLKSGKLQTLYCDSAIYIALAQYHLRPYFPAFLHRVVV